VRVVLHVHDELVAEVAKKNAKKSLRKIESVRYTKP
jgi:DNA polymerase I-like protein with 3'-5' exonuclease and polymerase domains